MPVNPHPTTRREGSGPSWGLGVGDAWGSREGEIQGLPAFLVPFYTVCYYQIKVGNIQKPLHCSVGNRNELGRGHSMYKGLEARNHEEGGCDWFIVHLLSFMIE